MNYLVIGEPCVDVIHKADGTQIKSYGGILYSIISMAVISGKDDTIIPLMNIGEDEYDNIKSVLASYPSIRTDGINKVKHPTRRVNLYYTLYNSDKSARIEKSTEPTHSLGFDQCEGFFNTADAILINMVSGVDISLGTLKNLRKNFSGYVHIDIHNIVMHTAPDGSRVHVPVDNWFEWCTNADTVQMNQFEIKTLSREQLSEYRIAEKVLLNRNYPVKGLIVTKGVDGVTGYSKSEKTYGEEKFFDLDQVNVTAIENPKFLDSTGCGDVFASAFTLEYSRIADLEKSIHYANRLASYNTSLEGIEELHKLA